MVGTGSNAAKLHGSVSHTSRGFGATDTLLQSAKDQVRDVVSALPDPKQMDDALDHQLQLRGLAEALDRTCSVNVDLRCSQPTIFDAVSAPAMSIHCYLVRLRRYTKFDFVCFDVALWYLAQLCKSGGKGVHPFRVPLQLRRGPPRHLPKEHVLNEVLERA